MYPCEFHGSPDHQENEPRNPEDSRCNVLAMTPVGNPPLSGSDVLSNSKLMFTVSVQTEEHDCAVNVIPETLTCTMSSARAELKASTQTAIQNTLPLIVIFTPNGTQLRRKTHTRQSNWGTTRSLSWTELSLGISDVFLLLSDIT